MSELESLKSMLSTIPSGVVVEYKINESGLIQWFAVEKPIGFDEAEIISKLNSESLIIAKKITLE